MIKDHFLTLQTSRPERKILLEGPICLHSTLMFPYLRHLEHCTFPSVGVTKSPFLTHDTMYAMVTDLPLAPETRLIRSSVDAEKLGHHNALRFLLH